MLEHVRRRGVVVGALPVGAAVAVGLAVIVPIAVPPLLVLGLASLVRMGVTLLDRLMVALATSAGVLMVAALIFSVWPWGLDPVALTVTAWCGLWALAVVARRRPELPRLSAADVAFPVAALATLVPTWRMLTVDGFSERLAVLMIGEDNSRHLTWFEAIAGAGSYIFLARDELADQVIRGSEFYPQGWHLTAAVLDTFGGGSDGAVAVDHFLVWTLVTHGYLVLCVAWLSLVAIRSSSPARCAAAAVVASCLVLGGELTRLLVSGYPGQSLAVSLVVSAVAVVVLAQESAPDAVPREAMCVLAGILVAVSFSYYVYLLPLGAFTLAWLWVRRRDVRRAPYLLAIAALSAAGLSSVMPLQGVRTAVASGGLETPGNEGPVLLTLVAVGGGVVAAAALSTRCRSRSWRWAAGGAVAFLLFGLLLSLQAGSGYYVHKVWHVTIAVAIALVSSTLALVPARTGARGRARAGVALVGAVSAVVVAAGITPWGPGIFTDPKIGTTSLGVWRSDFWAMTVPADVVARARRVPRAEPGVTSFVVDSDAAIGYRADLFLSALQGTSGSLTDVHYVPSLTQPDRLQQQLEAAAGPVRLLASSPEAAEMARGVVDGAPSPGRVRIVVLPASAG